MFQVPRGTDLYLCDQRNSNTVVQVSKLEVMIYVANVKNIPPIMA